jgi:5-methylcytosine-specific restriction protein A
MKRDQYLCRPCEQRGYVTAACAVDHIVPKSEGGTDDESNLQAICRDCHAAKTANESAKSRRP